MSKLSHVLIDLGFFSALGTPELIGGAEEKIYVGRGTPYTYDSNNGVTVVYDEAGRPWIIRNNYNDVVEEGLKQAISEHHLKHGAYVPHSNDGGQFVHEVLPTLD